MRKLYTEKKVKFTAKTDCSNVASRFDEKIALKLGVFFITPIFTVIFTAKTAGKIAAP